MTSSRRWHFVFKILALLLPFLALEFGLRAFDLARGASTRARTSWFWAFTQDKYLGYRPRADVDLVLPGGRNHIDTNSQGFRDDETPWQGPGSRRMIVALGESSTWGTGGANRTTTWPNRLERALSERSGENFVVLNAGVPGYTTVENLQLLKLRLLKYSPEAALYMGFRNDVEFYGALDHVVDLNLYPRRLAGLPRTWFHNILMSSSLGGLVVTRLGNIMPFDRHAAEYPTASDEVTTSRMRSLFTDQIALMKTLCDRHGIELLWVDQPISGQTPALASTRALLHETLAEQGIPLLEAHEIYDFDAFPLLDTVHLDDAGNEHLAELLAPQILRELDGGS